MQKPIFPLKFNIQTESVRLRVPILFLSLEMPVFFLSTVMSMNSRLLSTGAEHDNLCWTLLLEKSRKKKSGRGWPHHRFKMFCNHNCLLVMAWGGQWLLSCTRTRSKGCSQLSCLEPHPPHLLHYPSRKTMFHDFSHLAATPQPLWKQQDLHRRDSATAEVPPLLHPLVSGGDGGVHKW